MPPMRAAATVPILLAVLLLLSSVYSTDAGFSLGSFGKTVSNAAGSASSCCTSSTRGVRVGSSPNSASKTSQLSSYQVSSSPRRPVPGQLQPLTNNNGGILRTMPPQAGPGAPGSPPFVNTPTPVRGPAEQHITPKPVQPDTVGTGTGGSPKSSPSKNQELTKKAVRKVVKEALDKALEQAKEHLNVTEGQLAKSAAGITCAKWCQDECQRSGYYSPACIDADGTLRNSSQPDTYAGVVAGSSLSLIGQVLGVKGTDVCSRYLCLGPDSFTDDAESTTGGIAAIPEVHPVHSPAIVDITGGTTGCGSLFECYQKHLTSPPSAPATQPQPLPGTRSTTSAAGAAVHATAHGMLAAGTAVLLLLGCML